MAPAVPAAAASKPAPTQVWKRPVPAKPAEPAARTSPFQRPNPQTNAGRVPRPVGQGERQLDGTHTPTFDQPQKKPGLAERQPAPQRSAQQGGSGLESAMATLADQLHPRKQHSRSSR